MKHPIDLAKEQLDLIEKAMQSEQTSDGEFLSLHADMLMHYIRESIDEYEKAKRQSRFVRVS